MITIIFAPPRTGKTSFLTYVLNEYAFNNARIRQMQKEMLSKNKNGFNLSIPQHPVSANYDLTFKKFGYSVRYNRKINPYRLGFANPYVKTHFNFPFEVIGITEAQKYLNSRMSLYFPEWQSRWYEQHGHNNLDIFLDTQRPMLIDVNIRELAQFIEIISLNVKYNKDKKIKSLTWNIRIIQNFQLFDRYIASGKKDNSCYTEQKITTNYNVFELYDSESCKPYFYDGHFGEDIDYTVAQSPVVSSDGYKQYLLENDDELPQNFYMKRSKTNNA